MGSLGDWHSNEHLRCYCGLERAASVLARILPKIHNEGLSPEEGARREPQDM